METELEAGTVRVEPFVGPEFTDMARCALLWVLWHHQGANSEVGQPIRFALGMGKSDRLNAAQISDAKRYGAMIAKHATDAELCCPICGGRVESEADFCKPPNALAQPRSCRALNSDEPTEAGRQERRPGAPC